MLRTIRNLSFLAVGAFALIGLSSAWAQGQSYPAKPIRLAVGFATGGGTDTTARLFAQKLTAQLGQPVVVENRAGAAGSIAAGEVARSAPDGYRLLMLASGTFIHAALSPSVTYNMERDFTPISMVTFAPLVLVAGPSVTARSVKELMDFARANPGKLTFGSDGVGGTSHLAGEMFNMTANVKLTHVPFKGNADAMVSVASGQVDLGFPSIASAQSLLQAGKYRALAVTSAKRSALMPNVPTLNELGLAGFDISAWFAFVGPAGMPRPIVDRLNAAIAAVAGSPDTQESVKKQNLEVTIGSPEQLATYMRQQNAIISKLGKDANIKLD